MALKTKVLYLVSIAAFMRPFAQLIYVPSQVTMSQELGVSLAMIGLTLSVYALVFAFAQIFYGPIVDRFDGKGILLAGMIIFVIGSLGGYLAPNIGLLLLSRSLQGLGIASLVIVSVALISDVFPQSDRGRAMGVFEIFNAIGAAAGPIIGAVIATWLGWREDFLLMTILGAGILGYAYWQLPSQSISGKKVGPSEMVLILRTRATFGSVFHGLIKFYSLFTIFILLPILLTKNLNMGETESGFMTSVLPIGAIFGSFIGGWASDRRKMRPMLLVGTIVAFLGFSFLTYLSWQANSTTPIALIAGCVSICGFAIGFCLPMQLKLMVDYFPDMRATASGLLLFSRMIGATLTPVISGYLAQTYGVAAGFALTSVLLGIAFLVGLFTFYDKEVPA